MVSSTGKDQSLNLEIWCSQLYQVLPIHLYSFSGSSSFPVNALTLTIDMLWAWEFNLYCDSASQRMRFFLWFSAVLVSSVVRGHEDFLQSTHRDVQVIYVTFYSRIQILEFILSLPTLSSDVKSSQPVS